MKKLLLFILLVTGHSAYAQKYAIKGKVAEKQSGVLPSASVLLLQPKDSAVITYTTTSTAGLFVLSNIPRGNYIFKVTFLGFAPYFKNIATPALTDTLQMGTIELQPVVSELPLVSVTAPKNPVTVKQDTVEYNAGAFSTRPNANVEQLLKKLPGVDVESDGNIRVQGESVTRIFVDGKEFFGGDLQMATKNLPADAIDKVQVIDDKSEEAKFSGIADGQREKIINLTLKEDRRNMGFGKATAGIGTEKRYLAQANYNRFEKGNQVSVMGQSNNTNNQGLGDDEGGGGGGRNGMMNTHSGGVNVSSQLTPKTRVKGNYRLNYTESNIRRDLTRQNFLPGGTALYYENSRQQNKYNRHQGNAGLERKDSLNTVRLNTAFGYSAADLRTSSNRQSYAVTDSLVNEGERIAATLNKDYNLNANLFYGHRFRKTGRLFTITNQLATNQDEVKGRSESFTRFSQGSEEVIRQRNQQASNNLNYNLRFAYTEPLGNKQYLQANYNLSNRASDTNLEVFDIVNETSQYNPEQSNQFNTGYLYQQVGLTYRLAREKYNLSVGANGQRSELSRRLQEPDSEVKQSFRNILPSVNYSRRFTKFTRVNFDYTTSVREPSVQQLQPVVLRYDPLNLFVGNPDLRPEYTHQGRASFTSSAPASGIFLSGNLAFGYTTNPITAAVTITERQVRSTQYVNVKQSSNLSAFLNVGFPVKKYNSRFNLSPYLRYGQSVNLLNGVAGTINQRSAGGNISYTYRYEDYLDLNLRTNITVTSSKYEVNKNQDQVFVNSGYSADATLYFLKHFSLTAELDYNRFRNPGTNFNQAVPILDFSLVKAVLKENRGEIKISGLNVFNRSVGVTQLANINYLEQSTQNALGNYYLLSFTYNFNQHPSD